jgi:hypothetical protein
MEKLRVHSRIFGTVFPAKREAINLLAATRGLRKLSNLNGCPGLYVLRRSVFAQEPCPSGNYNACPCSFFLVFYPLAVF